MKISKYVYMCICVCVNVIIKISMCFSVKSTILNPKMTIKPLTKPSKLSKYTN